MGAITGIIGKQDKERYHLHTPTATIGIRGTDHEPMVVLPPLPGETSTIPPGTYDKVNVGATILTTQAGVTMIAPNQVGFAAEPDKAPMILPRIPDFYQAAPATETTQATQDEKPEEKRAAKGSSNVAVAVASSDISGTTNVPATDAVQTAPVSQLNLTAVDASGNTVNLTNTDASTVRGVAIMDGWQDHQGSILFDPAKTDISALFRGSVDGDVDALDDVVADTGGLTEFLGKARGFMPVGGSTSPTSFDPTGAMIGIGSAANKDLGSTAIGDITVSWGRWGCGRCI